MRRGHNGLYVDRYNHSPEMNDSGHRWEAAVVFLLREAGEKVVVDRHLDENRGTDFKVHVNGWPIPVQLKGFAVSDAEAARVAEEGKVLVGISGRLIDKAATPKQILDHRAACKVLEEFKRQFRKYAPTVVEVRWGRKAK